MSEPPIAGTEDVRNEQLNLARQSKASQHIGYWLLLEGIVSPRISVSYRDSSRPVCKFRMVALVRETPIDG